MSVTLNPSAYLGFHRPLTEHKVKRTLTITNHNALPVAFKIKVSASKLYCVRPNAGRIEPGESVAVMVHLYPMSVEPPLHVICRDKFLVQSTMITPDKENLCLAEIWNPTESRSGVQVYHQKIKVMYLPPEGQCLEVEEAAAYPSRERSISGCCRREEAVVHPIQETIMSEVWRDREAAAYPSQEAIISEDLRHYETVRAGTSGAIGHAPLFPISTFESSVIRPTTPRLASPRVEHAPPVSRPTTPRLASPRVEYAPPVSRPTTPRRAPPHMDELFVAAREEQSRVEEHYQTRVTPSQCPVPRQPSPCPPPRQPSPCPVPRQPSPCPPPCQPSPCPPPRQPSPCPAPRQPSPCPAPRQPSPCPPPRQPSPAPVVNVNVHAPPPQPSSLLDRSFVSSANISREDVKAKGNDLATKLVGAQNEIQRLRALLAAAPDPAEIKRRTRALSLEQTVASEGDAVSDVGTSLQEQHTCLCQESALPQQVGIVALLVFTITYLYF
ncbi:hypothetical protein JB92DRAFT_3098416 [Gautieria morchelliformis]|nr:hypothetical protein JB92DRAFT_3098416 [Gautieria morchelliformis]